MTYAKHRRFPPRFRLAPIVVTLLSGALSPGIATANESTGTASRSSIERESAQGIIQQGTPGDWGLTPQEWTRYKDIMRGPRGVYSPGLDPLTALGIEASSAEDRRRYAELQVQAERRRIDKELAYQRAYDQAFARLYPDEKVIQISSPQSSPVTARSMLKSDGRLAVFVEENCTACITRVQDLQKNKQAFDLYFVGGEDDDERIRRWAILAGIDPAKVRSRQVTLNHDGGRWLSLGLGGSLPALVRDKGGRMAGSD
ncbi:TIGR03759 family integrating conjugative element protein [Pseudomonas sp. RC10]|uniref:TIGR03759 family integrating conjugative element protein n=1 Tax=Pseudomonas bambusae TaxID=3139142 RepID=UPI0031387DBD